MTHARNGVSDVFFLISGDDDLTEAVDEAQVHLRIGLDLVTHARNGVSDVFFLISGDDDLTEAVDEAQVHGVQVVLLAVPTVDGKPHGVSRYLIRAADELDSLDGASVDAAVMKVDRHPIAAPTAREPAPEPAPLRVDAPAARPTARTPLDLASIPQSSAAPRSTSVLAYSVSTGSPARIPPGYDEGGPQDDLIDQVVLRVLSSFQESATADDKLELQRARPSIPRDIDRALLLDASDVLERYDLDAGVRYRLRARFWDKYDQN